MIAKGMGFIGLIIVIAICYYGYKSFKERICSFSTIIVKSPSNISKVLSDKLTQKCRNLLNICDQKWIAALKEEYPFISRITMEKKINDVVIVTINLPPLKAMINGGEAFDVEGNCYTTTFFAKESITLLPQIKRVGNRNHNELCQFIQTLPDCLLKNNQITWKDSYHITISPNKNSHYHSMIRYDYLPSTYMLEIVDKLYQKLTPKKHVIFDLRFKDQIVYQILRGR